MLGVAGSALAQPAAQANCIGELISERATTTGVGTGEFVREEARAGRTGETVGTLAPTDCGARAP